MRPSVNIFLIFCLSLSALLFASTSLAAGVRVEAMQMPAWVTRADVKQVLKPGTELNSGDLITTGAGARMLLRMGEGSLIKMALLFLFPSARNARSRC